MHTQIAPAAKAQVLPSPGSVHVLNPLSMDEVTLTSGDRKSVV